MENQQVVDPEKNEEGQVIFERIDDVPLLIGVMKRIQLPVILDKHLGNHGNQTGLSNGWTAVIWIAYILSQGKHTKMHVQEWVMKRQKLLEELSGEEICAEDFNDDSLGRILERFSDEDSWQRIEQEYWMFRTLIHEVKLSGVRLDSTSSYGYHTPEEDGVMQLGHSKDHRPDLAQVKLMMAVAEPSGEPIASDVVAGNRADDGLYLPLLRRVWGIVKQVGLLYTGDSKMAAHTIRAEIVEHGDYYLTVAPRTGETADAWESWLAPIVDGEQSATLLWHDNRLLGAGYEFSRPQTAIVNDQVVEWVERVQIVRSPEVAQKASVALEARLQKATAALLNLTPAVGRGRRQLRDEEALRKAIAQTLERHQVMGLLEVDWQVETTHKLSYVGPGRGGVNRPTQTTTHVRYVITAVNRQEDAINHQKHRFGWRVYLTNLPSPAWSLTDTISHYREGYCVERDFHLFKDQPLGLSPLFVHLPNQIIGLTHLLTIALRILTLIETTVRDALQEQGESLDGLYEGQPRRSTNRPTAIRILRLFSRSEVSRIGFFSHGQWHWRLTPLPSLSSRILTFLRLPSDTYLQLGNSP